MTYDLERFKQAQDREGIHDAALAELRAGSKVGHWIWFVFPQLRGLGRSSVAERYGILDADEAAAYLEDAVLRSRLCEAVEAVHEQACERGVRLRDLMGGNTDAMKLVSCLTLFSHVARIRAEASGCPDASRLVGHADEILVVAATQGLPRCRLTIEKL